MKPEVFKKNIKVFKYIIIALIAILCVRLAVVQLFQSEIFETQAKENRIRLLSIQPTRGEIYANQGEILAANQLVYTVSITYTGIEDHSLIIEELSDILIDYFPEVTPEYIQDKIDNQRFRLFEPITIIRDIPWDLVVQIEENRQNLPGVMILVEPFRDYPHEGLAGHVLGYIHSISKEELERVDSDFYTMNSLIGKSGIEKQYEDELRGKAGARRVEVDARGRPVGELVTLEPIPGNNLQLTLDLELQQVMENSMEEILNNLQEQRNPKAKVGSAVVMNVKTGEILSAVSYPQMYPDDWKGDINQEKASYYFPQTETYDPMDPGASLNRFLQVTYPPGSTFKPITGMAALDAEHSHTSVDDYVNCQGRYWIAPYIRCTGVHGNVDYYSGMGTSCNVYFQEIGRRANKEEIIRVAKEFGLGERTNVDLPHEAKGLMPTPEWKQEINQILTDRQYDFRREQLEDKYEELYRNAEDEDELSRLERQYRNEKAQLEAQYQIDFNFNTTWQAFDTFNVSIGQGSNDFTVLQLANYTSTIANGGNLMRPYIVSRILSPDGTVLKETKPSVINKADVSPYNIAETRRAMWEVARPGGTAYHLFHHFPEDVPVAAKTGTAETGRAGDEQLKEFHGVFIAFAPYDDPEIAFAGVVEYGQSGGGSAGQVAKDVFEQYFGIVDHLADEDQLNFDISIDE
ncbi:Peptidoglycan D,D-transpeptidase MrdA [Candidatus Syntrophocurvum alkaliphilum]|uniref:Peptidoglycan D,D-transpeptidase MrdA n=1 Tax=Candidatus Syntrophocurvum alkaliphilum TaxID=2293317 RepID=A0A6I6DBN5_9FIRM|nr:penicillin-binding transpeptidase domain-containing protein [Candidatus Syntrophocurvum alkaliphilum]QGU00046.1 Peptidoglycan D,D-transpeptidase MrdA [Candidatus Syntrophocurvum alkaliphilum]